MPEPVRDLPLSRSPAPTTAAEAAGLRRVLTSTAALFVAYALPRIATFAAVVVAARVVGVAAFGVYGTAAALAVILSITATLGMMQMLVRELAREPDDAPRLLAAANLAKAGSGAVMMVALGVLAAWVLAYPPRVVAATLLLGLSYVVGSYVENLGAYFQARERMAIWMQAQALFGLVSGALGTVLVVATGSIVVFCAAPVVGQAAALGWLAARAPGPVRRAWRAPWPRVRRLLVSLLPFAATFVLLTAYYKVDILLVEHWRGAGAAGIYAAGYKFVDVGHALALVVATAVYPRLSRGGAEKGPWAARRIVELLILMAVPAAGLLWLIRVPLVAALFGPGYGAAAPVLGLLAVALPALAINVLATFILAAARRLAPAAAFYGGALVVNVAANAVLIPALGARGAAAAMVLSEWLLAAGMLAVLRREAAAPVVRVAAAALTAGAVAGILVWLAVPPVLAVPAYAGVVAVVYAGLKVVSGRELGLLRRAVLP